MHRHIRSVATIAALSALALFASSCRSGGSEGDAGSAKTIEVASVLDVTGPLNVYGLAMNNATKLAVSDINEHGGLLGKKLKLDDLDAQSDNARYSVLAKQVVSDKPAVVMGGVTSASREVIRPIFHQAKIPYFYNILYEGGVCDKNTFVTGETPTQQLAPLLKWASDQGLKKWYVLAANYNYGQISAAWVKKYAAEQGATIVGGPSFFDLTVTDFASEIPKIQASGADLIVSLLVGGAHENFYKQWRATGLNKNTTVISPTFGAGAEQVSLGKDGAGIDAAFSYFPAAQPSSDDALATAWAKAGYKATITPAAVSTWNAWHLWANAVKKAKSTEHDKVIAALESGISYDGPGGEVSIEPGSHHTIMPIKLWQDTASGVFKQIKVLDAHAKPGYEMSKCDLVAHPDLDQQFTP